ncbi:MAG: hypothetical protein HQK89_00955 [Nitrospirae bacterium]|nr:hypothetical protein [Nitrospirota bacterium]
MKNVVGDNKRVNKTPTAIAALILYSIGAVLILTGCTPLTTIRYDGSVVKHYFGYVKVIEPPTFGHNEEFKVSEIETFGLRIYNGMGVGYFHERNEFIPLDCRLVIRVTDKRQLDRVFETLSNTKIMEEGICATVSP